MKVIGLNKIPFSFKNQHNHIHLSAKEWFDKSENFS